MKKFILSFLLFVSLLAAEPRFGYLSYSTFNIGDDIQSVAAMRFLPEKSVPIDREFLAVYRGKGPVHTIVNGWFTHGKDLFWYRDDVAAPNKCWPPSKPIKPLLISMHMIKEFLPYALSDESLRYYEKYGPVGCRDTYTLEKLQEKGVASYYSGCLTLTLENPYTEREDVIYAVDLDDACYEELCKRTTSQVIRLTHDVPKPLWNDRKGRFALANELLDKYRKAKAVVTRRLHVAMPCLAFETPVLFLIAPEPRVDGLIDLARHCTRDEFLAGAYDFDFESPPENPKDYLSFRESLIRTVEEWKARILQ